MRLQHCHRLVAGRRAWRLRAVRRSRRGGTDLARIVTAGTLRLRTDSGRRSHASEPCGRDDGRGPAWALQGRWPQVRRRGAHQPPPSRSAGRARMTRLLPTTTAELARWRDEGLVLRVWWRDDDAV